MPSAIIYNTGNNDVTQFVPSVDPSRVSAPAGHAALIFDDRTAQTENQVKALVAANPLRYLKRVAATVAVKTAPEQAATDAAIAAAATTTATRGIATLVAGTVTVAKPRITANTLIFLTPQSGTLNLGSVGVSARVAGVSFTILSTNALDTRQIGWMIIEP